MIGYWSIKRCLTEYVHAEQGLDRDEPVRDGDVQVDGAAGLLQERAGGPHLATTCHQRKVDSVKRLTGYKGRQSTEVDRVKRSTEQKVDWVKRSTKKKGRLSKKVTRVKRSTE